MPPLVPDTPATPDTPDKPDHPDTTSAARPRRTFVYLASQSPRRRQLLEQAGVRFEPLPPAPHEDAEALEAHRAGELPAAYVQRVTALKLRAALRRLAASALPPAPVLCADTTVALGTQVLGKPVDAADAAAMLRRLAGRTHRVLTAVAVHDGRRVRRALSISRVRFAPLPAQVIAAYVAGGEPFGKAGAYAIQGALAGWIAHIEGSHSGIMGLPLFETVRLLHAAGIETALTHV
ncbi:MAG: septum formation inhibitor Maf [Burkholderiales bacterium]|nr:septum formation inhibitor Maf [Burkholderiales bacterium]